MAPWVIPAAITGFQAISNWFGGKQQGASNMKLAKYQNEFNYRMWQENNAYNSPASQMSRFKEAGLNPNLMYGQGSPGNSPSPVQSADIKPADYQRAFDMAPLANQTAMTMAQVQAIKAETVQKNVVTELRKLETQVVARNPLLNDGAFAATINGLISSAAIKANEVKTSAIGVEMAEASKGWVVQKIAHEVELLEQRFKLGEVDMKIKAEILNSAQFNNAILEIQKKFMVDGNVGPQQIYWFIQTLLTKAADFGIRKYGN